MKLELAAAARAMDARPGPGGIPEGTTSGGWSVDTRTLNRGDVFFALRGDNHDGHAWVQAATEKGAAAVVVESETGAPRELVVEDTLVALQRLAAHARLNWGGTVVGVTGSAGKTTTKDAIAHLLSAELRVGKTVGNFNNHVGVPLSILRLPDECRVAVLEMGMNHAGEIRRLAGIAAPQIGVVTNVGYAHVECFSGIEGVAAAKRELIEALPAGGTAVLNADDPLVAAFRETHPGPVVTFGLGEGADVRAVDVDLGCAGSRFRVDGVAFESPLAGRHGVLNALAALAVARVLGIPAARLGDAVRTLPAGKMRSERLEHDGVTVWNDCYNANPEAMRAMIDVLAATPAARRVAVLGEMLELGRAAEALHREVGRYAAARGIDLLVGVRGAARWIVEEARQAGMTEPAARFFETPETAGEFAREHARAGDAVLFKGSRGVAMERALERFLI
ncbi:MAG TPA: UDP-N-acetylmuramoyl-tripeptide--D-alanyl-D-alanine ligase [Bryobacteraceae bacterium]|nr:UDP-N-acetylmuramoyl-tripeptide--D-alanyl-D-alanine ligase [Bryobacteraceae bacterium]